MLPAASTGQQLPSVLTTTTMLPHRQLTKCAASVLVQTPSCSRTAVARTQPGRAHSCFQAAPRSRAASISRAVPKTEAAGEAASSSCRTSGESPDPGLLQSIAPMVPDEAKGVGAWEGYTDLVAVSLLWGACVALPSTGPFH